MDGSGALRLRWIFLPSGGAKLRAFCASKTCVWRWRCDGGQSRETGSAARWPWLAGSKWVVQRAGVCDLQGVDGDSACRGAQRRGHSCSADFLDGHEDHDLDEVRHVTWFDAGKLTRFELPWILRLGGPSVRCGSELRSKEV